MKNWVKICLVVVISASLFGAGYFTAYRIVKKDKETITVKEEENRFGGPSLFAKGIGRSMEPTLQDGQIYPIYKIDPREGDIVVFTCSKEQCMDIKDPNVDGLTKRLIKIREDGAWWVLGDNRAVSHDSEDFGWVLPSERSNVWVVKVD